jgi:hypothetical protein
MQLYQMCTVRRKIGKGTLRGVFEMLFLNFIPGKPAVSVQLYSIALFLKNRLLSRKFIIFTTLVLFHTAVRVREWIQISFM